MTVTPGANAGAEANPDATATSAVKEKPMMKLFRTTLPGLLLLECR